MYSWYFDVMFIFQCRINSNIDYGLMGIKNIFEDNEPTRPIKS